MNYYVNGIDFKVKDKIQFLSTGQLVTRGKEFLYAQNETVTFNTTCAGSLTNSSKDVQFYIPCPKIKGVNSITLKTLTIQVLSSVDGFLYLPKTSSSYVYANSPGITLYENGTYANGFTSSSYTMNCSIVNDGIYINLAFANPVRKNTTATATNNVPLTVRATTITLTTGHNWDNIPNYGTTASKTFPLSSDNFRITGPSGNYFDFNGGTGYVFAHLAQNNTNYTIVPATGTISLPTRRCIGSLTRPESNEDGGDTIRFFYPTAQLNASSVTVNSLYIIGRHLNGYLSRLYKKTGSSYTAISWTGSDYHNMVGDSNVSSISTNVQPGGIIFTINFDSKFVNSANTVYPNNTTVNISAYGNITIS